MIPQTFKSDNGVEMYLAATSGWRYIYTCPNCDEYFDDDDYKEVCPKCGSIVRQVCDRIGRWHAYHPNSTVWQYIKSCFSSFEIPFVLMKVEFKESV